MIIGLDRNSICILVSALLVLVSLGACSSSDSGTSDANDNGYTETECTGTADDSTQNLDGSAARISSHSNGSPTYYMEGTRRTAANSIVYMDYMVHEPAGTPEAMLVLIAGGSFNAGITGTNGGTVDSSGGNFLVRSAHLFAAQGYCVVTVDRPTDYTDWIGAYSYEFDPYRISVNHAVDLSRVINNVKARTGHNLPVVICGTSRGAVSAVNQHFLADAIAISSPVTSGSGTPVGSAGGILPSDIAKPAHVLWHVLDGCSVTVPADAAALLNDFPDVAGDELDGGFADTVAANPCGALDYHGFLGIESCAVTATTDWIASLTFDATRPTTATENSRVTTPIDPDEVVDIDLTSAATPAAGGALNFSLPHGTTSLGGTVSLTGSTVTYTPPAGLSGTRDTFVYVVSETGGGKAHNRVVVQIN